MSRELNQNISLAEPATADATKPAAYNATEPGTAEAAGLALLLTLAVTLTVGGPLMLLGVAVGPLHIVAGFAVAVAIVWRLSSAKTALKAAGIVVAVAAAAIFVAINTVDSSFDGFIYHQEMANAVATNQWNPYTDTCDTDTLWIWSSHYAMALEWLAGAIISLSGMIESGKAVNLLLIVATALICHAAIKRRLAQLTAGKRCVLLALLILNPVAICQGPTFYIDFAFYYYLLLTIVFSLDIFDGHKRAVSYFGLAATIVLAVTTKFNAFFMEWVTIAAIALGIAIYGGQRRHELKRYLIVAAAVAAVAAMVVGWHPYMTNLINHGHPLYPLMGEGAQDIMTENTPDIYAGHNRVANFLTSVFSAKRPSIDSRQGGMGPLFAILFIAAIAWLAINTLRHHRLTPTGYAAAVVLLSCFIFEQSWWARYVTQLWLLVPIIYLSMALASSRWVRRAATAVAIVGFIDVAACMGAIAYHTSLNTTYRNAIFDLLQGDTAQVSFTKPHFERHFAEHGIAVKEVGFDSIQAAETVNMAELKHLQPEFFPCIKLTAEQCAALEAALAHDPAITVCHTVKSLISSAMP